MAKNLTFYDEDENIKFNYRVAAIIKDKDRLLFQKSTNNPYYSLLGGRVEFGEDSLTALVRELEEETGILLSKEDFKLVRIIENFFEYHLDHKKFHELLFVYEIKAPKELIEKDNYQCLDKEIATNVWIDKKEIPNITIQPIEILGAIEDSNFKHIINC
jgi:8-oxo-dGTP pyrophosphatase MutT (NUDIX family)